MTLQDWFEPPIWRSNIYLIVIIHTTIQERLLGICLVEIVSVLSRKRRKKLTLGALST